MRRWGLWLALLLVLLPPVQVLVLRWLPPPVSSFMLIRQGEAWLAGDWRFRIAYAWRDAGRISPHLPVALVAAEDQLFAEHAGFDLAAMEKARKRNQQGGRIRGGSTISQQTAKNLFLWSGRGWTRWLRKALEAYYTFWIELFWPKTRILEVYANVAEFGDGVYGAEAAARRYFRKPAAQLGAGEAARMAAVLPNPKRYRLDKPGPYVERRSRAIERQMRNIGGREYLEKLQ